jgi:dihydroneopterin aldolase
MIIFNDVRNNWDEISSGERMDKVYISELEIEAIIGIYEWEREKKQTISIDVEMGWDNRPASAGDDISKALDYKSVAKRIIGFVESSEFLLVETLAEEIAGIVITEFLVPWLRLRVSKPGAVTGSKDVGVVIERTAKDFDQS